MMKASTATQRHNCPLKEAKNFTCLGLYPSQLKKNAPGAILWLWLALPATAPTIDGMA